MKRLFQSIPAHIITSALMFWKGFSLILWILLDLSRTGCGMEVFASTGSFTPLWLMLVAGLSNNRTFLIAMLIAICISILAFWVFFVLFAINRSCSSAGSIALLVFCIIDLPITFTSSLSQWWTALLCIVFHAALFISMAVLRRSRPGARDALDTVPNSL